MGGRTITLDIYNSCKRGKEGLYILSITLKWWGGGEKGEKKKKQAKTRTMRGKRGL